MPLARHTIRWGDTETFGFAVPAAVAFNQTDRRQVVDARVDYPTSWLIAAQARVQTLEAGDELSPLLEVVAGIGASRVTYLFPLATLTALGQFTQLNDGLGAFLPVWIPAEALYIDLIVTVNNPGAATAHRAALAFSVGVAPVFREDRLPQEGYP